MVEMKRAELRLMEMGAALERILSRSVTDPKTEIEVLRKQFGITPVNTLEIQVEGLCKIPLIQWVRNAAPEEPNLYWEEGDPIGKRMTKMGLRKAKELVESWIGLANPAESFYPEKFGQTVRIEVPCDWDMTVEMPQCLKVVY